MHPFLNYYRNPATTYETLEQKALEFQSIEGTAVYTLAEVFVEDYARAEAYFLLQIIQEQGTKKEAALLYEVCVVEHRLKDKVPEQLLVTFGKLHYKPA